MSIDKNMEDFEEALKGMKIEPEMMDEDSSVARIDELGNQVHNLSCFQDDEYLSEKLDAVAMTLWELGSTELSLKREASWACPVECHVIVDYWRA